MNVSDQLFPRERHVTVGRAQLYVREIGEGQPIIVLHGGPDFDHTYLLPELDRLAGSCRLIYYDQRGRGRSAARVRPQEVSLHTELADLEALRRHFGLESFALLGHSWGGLLAMEYATRHTDRVSHLILVNTGPPSHDGLEVTRQYMSELRPTGDVERLRELASSDAFRQGDLDIEAEWYGIHFGVTLRRPEQLRQLLGRLRQHFTPEGVVLARAIEQRLYAATWRSADYDLTPRLRTLDVPTLVLRGEDEYDFIPVEIAERITDAIPGARLAVIEGCGHFTYLEAPEVLHDHIAALLTDG